MAKPKPIVEEPKVQEHLRKALEFLEVLHVDVGGGYAHEYIGTPEEIQANREAFAQAHTLLNAATRNFNGALKQRAKEVRGELDAIEAPAPRYRALKVAKLED